MNPEDNMKPEGFSQPDNKLLMEILAYLGPLVLVPYLVAKDDPFVKFHIKQGLVVFSLEVIIWLLSFVVWQLWFILNLLNLAVLILSIIGIINVSQKKMQALPIVGQFSHYFNI
jgi:uncharacterized membrane protein